MSDHLHDYYEEFTDNFTQSGHFHKVIKLHESPDIDWGGISKRIPDLPKGWYELSRLSSRDRIEFTRDFWLSKIPYIPHIHDAILKFFDNLDNIGIYATQKNFDELFESQLVYHLKKEQGFYHGRPPLSEEETLQLHDGFKEYVPSLNYTLPPDYLSFLEIHDGFSKYTDTGVILSGKVQSFYRQFQEFLKEQGPLIDSKGEEVNPFSLIPFYESFGLHCYQCFWGDWYPEQEMGNVYYSGIEGSLSDISDQEALVENMAFPTFMDWLIFYLENVT